MKLVGVKISEYRKAKNLTQMELADLLNVSHQAISNWERGETMPDITKLPEIAEIFNTTIDQLLNSEKGAKIISNVVSGKISEKLTIEEFKNISPILKPKQIEDLSDELKVDNFDDIISILPFIGEETADKLVTEALDHLNNVDNIVSILPFVNEETADKLVGKYIEINGKITEVVSILPFVSTETADKIVVNMIENNNEINNIVSFLPFISEETADLLVIKYLNNKGEIENINAMMPFVSTECADQLVLNYIEKGRKVSNQVLPFISSKLADQLVLSIIKNK
jgi:transcriptional regulator with XRE-family HTH domain